MENYEKNSKKSQNTKAAILQCALELIKKDGYSNVTIQQICREAAITKSTFYYHFESKEHLLEDFTNQVGYIVEDNYSNILMQDTYIKQLWEIFKIYFVRNHEVGAEITKQVFISSLDAGDQEDFPRSAYAWKMVLNLIEKAKKEGQIFNPYTAEEIGEALYSATRGCCVTWSIENGSFDLIEKCRNVMNAILIPVEGFKL